MYRGIPVEPEVGLARPGTRTNVLIFKCRFAETRDPAALVFDIDQVLVPGIDLHPHSVADADGPPVAVVNSARMTRGRHPGAVVLQSAIHVVGRGHVESDVIELRNR